MTKQEAKKLTLEMWKEIANDGEIMDKSEISLKLYYKIKYLKFECPLCELFNKKVTPIKDNWSSNCSGCPLKEANNQCFSGGDFYSEWGRSVMDEEERSCNAQGIVNIVENWKIT